MIAMMYLRPSTTNENTTKLGKYKTKLQVAVKD
jgi:hypothetical protein